MTSIIRFDNLIKFAEHNQDFLNENTLVNHYMIDSINRIIDKKLRVYDAFNLVVEKNNDRVCVMVTEEACLLYGSAIDGEAVKLLSDTLTFSKFTRFRFAGNKQLVDQLLLLNNSSFEVIKHRIFYRCDTVPKEFKLQAGSLSMANPLYINELTNFAQQFSNAYYILLLSEEEARNIIKQGIRRENLMEWDILDEPCSIAQIMYDDHAFPVIGLFYTDPRHRGKGYGASLIYSVTKGLLEHDHKFCMLVADAMNPASNKVFINAGYKKVGEYINVDKIQ